MIIGLADSLDPKDRKKLVTRIAEAEGCTCHPTVDPPKLGDDGIYHIRVSHDNWCHLLQRRQARFN